jgi:uncharacterized coiled-coil protein SlyX
MATKSTLEAANVALNAQVAEQRDAIAALLDKVDTLAGQVQAAQVAEPKPAKPAKPADVPRVTRGYFKRLDEATGKWIDDTTRPCIVVHVPDIDGKKVKDEKMTAAAFESRYITNHATLVNAYNALA